MVSTTGNQDKDRYHNQKERGYRKRQGQGRPALGFERIVVVR
jgi:hypothetical protein